MKDGSISSLVTKKRKISIRCLTDFQDVPTKGFKKDQDGIVCLSICLIFPKKRKKMV
jgi:hypothetical protein